MLNNPFINAFAGLDLHRNSKPKVGKPGDKLRRKAAEGKLGLTYGRTSLYGIIPERSRGRKNK